METKKNVASMVEDQKSSPALLVLAIILLLVLGAAGFYLFFQKSAILAQQDQLKTDLSALHQQMNELKSTKVEAAQLAKNWLNDLQKSEILWSKVITALRKTVPTNTFNQTPKVRFLSYSGSTGGKLTLNVETLPAVAPPFADVAELVNVFNNNAYFKNAYVPSISRGLAQNGSAVLSFIFNVTYSEEIPANITPTTLVVPATTIPAEVTPVIPVAPQPVSAPVAAPKPVPRAAPAATPKVTQ